MESLVEDRPVHRSFKIDSSMRTFALVCLAGAAGTGLRYLVSTAFAEHVSRSFPFGTLTINIVGSFLMGVLMPLALKRSWPLPVVAMVTTGFLGGFTTYSTFNYDTTVYFSTGHALKALGYIAATVLGGLAAGFLGLLISE